jgi:hypothetical protein
VTSAADIGKDAGIAIGIAAAACSVVPGIGTGVCAAGAAVASALVAAGVGIAGLTKDHFHVSIAQSEALLTLIRLYPWLLFIGRGGIDNTGEPHQGARLVRYLRVTSNEVPTGTAGNTGRMHNPNDKGDCSDNPYLCATDETALRASYARRAAWLAAGRHLEQLGPALQSPYQTPAAAVALLGVIRSAPAPFVEVMGWAFAKQKGIRQQLQAAIHYARTLAGETGADPDPAQALETVFGPEVATAPTGVSPVPTPEAPPAPPAPTEPPPDDELVEAPAPPAPPPDVIRTAHGAALAGVLERRGLAAGLFRADSGRVFRPLGWWSGLYVPVKYQEVRL